MYLVNFLPAWYSTEFMIPEENKYSVAHHHLCLELHEQLHNYIYTRGNKEGKNDSPCPFIPLSLCTTSILISLVKGRHRPLVRLKHCWDQSDEKFNSPEEFHC